MNSKFYSLAAATICLCLLNSETTAAGNVIPFQGQLANQSGEPLSPAGPSTIVFRLYQQAVGGIAIWEESHANISVNAGRFSVLLGSRTQLPGSSVFNATVYLGITVDDGNPATADVEMRPRQAIVPVINAVYSQDSNKLQGYDWSPLFGTNNPVDGSILSGKIADGSIDANKLTPKTLTATNIFPGTITSNEISRGTIGLELLVQKVAEALVPPGSIVSFGGHTNAIPSGWFLCNGDPLSSETYPELFAAIGTNWGVGIDVTLDFNLPDLRGLFLRGVSGDRSGSFSDPNASSRTNGPSGGNRGNFVGSLQSDQLIRHRHGDVISKATHPAGDVRATSTATGPSNWDATGNSNNPFTSNAGGDETRPRNAYVHFIIKY